jgi:hypothetical protein
MQQQSDGIQKQNSIGCQEGSIKYQPKYGTKQMDGDEGGDVTP